VQMSQYDVLDFKVVFRGERDVFVCIALRVDHCRRARRLVTDEI